MQAVCARAEYGIVEVVDANIGVVPITRIVRNTVPELRTNILWIILEFRCLPAYSFYAGKT